MDEKSDYEDGVGHVKKIPKGPAGSNQEDAPLATPDFGAVERVADSHGVVIGHCAQEEDVIIPNVKKK